MSLITTSNLPIASPMSNSLSRQIGAQILGAQAQDAREKVGMMAIMNWYLLDVRGIEVEAILTGAYQTSKMLIGAVQIVPDGILIRLRQDEFLLLTNDLKAAQDHLESKPVEALVTLSDITHGRGVICLCGACAADVLPKLCGLNFLSAKFPDCHAAQTSLAKVRTLIMRMDAGQVPAYYLIVDRSLADYVWEIVSDAIQEWSGTILSQDSLEQLRK